MRILTVAILFSIISGVWIAAHRVEKGGSIMPYGKKKTGKGGTKK